MWLSLLGKKTAITFRPNGDIVEVVTGEKIAVYYETDKGWLIVGRNVKIIDATRQDAMILWAEVISGDKQQCGYCKKIGEGMRRSKAFGWDICRSCDVPMINLLKS